MLLYVWVERDFAEGADKPRLKVFKNRENYPYLTMGNRLSCGVGGDSLFKSSVMYSFKEGKK